ncbi:MAG: hypothetical protein N3D82_03740 [Ignisphaera sp.]|nr:hypothetical protein [Ignisphaera sp.]MCX8168119.1 hypothetical protein [Ignisphaera sp.]MDW8085446.1 hypothetical protein [Ignisphaera sp.]
MKNIVADVKKLTIVGTIIALVISTYIHLPKTYIYFENFGLKYTDITYGTFYRLFDSALLNDPVELSRVWYNNAKFKSLIEGVKLCPIPYTDYKFEHPPLIGGIWYVTTCAAIHIVLPQKYDVIAYKYYLDDLARVNYILNITIIAIAFILLVINFVKLVELLNLELKLSLLLPLLPSTIIYATYGWDILTISLAFMAFYLYAKSMFFNSNTRYLVISFVLFGLSIVCNMLMAIPVVVIVYELIQLIRNSQFYPRLFTKLALTLISIIIVPNIIVYLSAGPKGLQDVLALYTSHYCENCLYLLLIPDILSSTHKVLYIILLTTTVLTILTIQLKSIKLFICSMFLTITSTTIFNYVFKPQMWMLITPLALLMLAYRRRLLLLYSVADLCNSTIIITFFKDYELRMWLSKYIHGLSLEQNPLSIYSPVQWIVSIRNIILLVIFIVSLFYAHELNRYSSKDYY